MPRCRGAGRTRSPFHVLVWATCRAHAVRDVWRLLRWFGVVLHTACGVWGLVAVPGSPGPVPLPSPRSVWFPPSSEHV